jgi:hypothetical protein
LSPMEKFGGEPHSVGDPAIRYSDDHDSDGAGPEGPRSHLRFNADSVIHGCANALLRTEVAFRSLYRHMPEKKLNLF